MITTNLVTATKLTLKILYWATQLNHPGGYFSFFQGMEYSIYSVQCGIGWYTIPYLKVLKLKLSVPACKRLCWEPFSHAFF